MSDKTKDAQFEKWWRARPMNEWVLAREGSWLSQVCYESDKGVWEASRAATLREVIEALPEEGRYDSSIHDAGDINYFEGFNATLKEIRDRLEGMK